MEETGAAPAHSLAARFDSPRAFAVWFRGFPAPVRRFSCLEVSMRSFALALFALAFVACKCGGRTSPSGNDAGASDAAHPDGGANPDGGGNPDAGGPDGGGCPACASNQHCDGATKLCVCDDACSATGPVCDPKGSNQLGTCGKDANGCFVVTGLGACASSGQVCPTGKTACECAGTPVCTAGETRCNAAGDSVETCGTDASGCPAFLPGAKCPDHQKCAATSTGPGCLCDDACSPAGPTPAIQCSAAGSGYDVCTSDANSCRYWAAKACPGSEVCDPAKVTAGTVPPCSCQATPVCTVGDQRCNPTSGNPEICIVGPGGCEAWQQKQACSAGVQTCVVSAGGTASCQCNPAGPCDAGTLGDTFCPVAGGTQFQTCRVDAASGCFYLTAAANCPSAQQTCVAPGGNNTAGSCECNPATTCNPATPPSCTGNDLSTCKLDAVGGCGVAKTVNCPTDYGAGSTCSNSGGTAHCTCPAPSGTTLTVDAVAGDDQNGTGAAAPPACAFQSITHAMDSVGNSFTKIVARPGTYSDATTGEVFPIELKNGITLTTDGPPGPNAVYLISGAGQTPINTQGQLSAAVYSISATGSLENFTLQANPGADGFACGDSAGNLLLTGVTVTGSYHGFGIYGSCGPTLANTVSTKNSSAGVELASGGTTTVGNHLSDGDGDGIHSHAGAATVNIAELKNATGANGSSGAGLRVNPQNFGSTAPINFAATGLSVHDNLGSGLLADSGNQTAMAAFSVSGSSFQNNGVAGLRLRWGSFTFSGIKVLENQQAGVVVDVNSQQGGHTVAIDGASITQNCKGGACQGVLLSSGALTLAGSPTASANVSSNDGVGIQMNGGSFNGTNVVVASNTGEGVHVDAGDGAGFTCAGCTVALNGSHGYHVLRSPATGGGPTFILAPAAGQTNGGTVTGNGTGNSGGAGLFLEPQTGNVAALVHGLTIGSHKNGAGVILVGRSPGGAGQLNASVYENEITGNGGPFTRLGAPNPLAVGGVVLVPGWMGLGFGGNLIHDNLGTGVAIVPGMGMTTTLDLSTTACANTASHAPNSIYCYGTDASGKSNVGVVAYDGALVVWNHQYWNSATPASGTDYAGGTWQTSTSGTVTVDPALVCGKAGSCP